MTKTVKLMTVAMGMLVCGGIKVVHALPPGSPGLPFSWAGSAPQAVGTAAESSARLWFTVTEGALGSLYYPTPDQPQLADLELVFVGETSGRPWVLRQKHDLNTSVSTAKGGLTVLISGHDPLGRLSFEQELIADTSVAVLRVRTTLHLKQPGIRVFAVLRPAPGGLGGQALVSAHRDLIAASSPDSRSHLVLLSPQLLTHPSAGYVGFSDAITELERSGTLSADTLLEREAGPGHVAATFEITPPPTTAIVHDFRTEWAIGLGRTRVQAQLYAQASLAMGFDRARQRFERGWQREIERAQNSRVGRSMRFALGNDAARRSFALLRMHEDKSTPGWFVPTFQNEPRATGLSARELYRLAMGLMAFGDADTPLAIFRVLARDTAARETNAAALLLLGAQLSDRAGTLFTRTERNALADAAAALTNRGPSRPGYGVSAGDLAFDLAALKAASSPKFSAQIATNVLLGESATRALGETIDLWQSRLEYWTYVEESYLAKGYYVRNPVLSAPAPATWENVDRHVLDLARFAVRAPNDPRVLASLKVLDQLESLERPAPTSQDALQRIVDHALFAVSSGDLRQGRMGLAELENAPAWREGIAYPPLSAHAEYLNLQRSLEEGRPFDRTR